MQSGMIYLGAMFVLLGLVETGLIIGLKWPSHRYFQAVLLTELGMALGALGFFRNEVAGVVVASLFLAGAAWTWVAWRKQIREWHDHMTSA